MYKYNVSNHIEKVKNEVAKLLEGDNSGHGLEHINRVLDLSLKFAEKENANKYIVSLIALLHDADDYKLFGMENAEKLTNAKIIMDDCNVDKAIQEQVCDAINNIGYSKRLKGHSPTTLEGKIVSDVDMCDALGANGILRVYTYSMKNGKPFFDRNIFPIEDMNAEKYTRKCADSSVCHIFEKILKLKDLMLTDSGKEESKNRHQIVVDFLYHLFNEENAPEWIEYLNNYLYTHYYDKIKDITLIGITGTNGKTTSCYLLYEMLKLLNVKCAYIGTIGFYIDSKVCDLDNTTPELLDLYDMFLKCKSVGVKVIVMEVSSHALYMDRVKDFKYDYVVFTNLTADHLLLHKTMEISCGLC